MSAIQRRKLLGAMGVAAGVPWRIASAQTPDPSSKSADPPARFSTVPIRVEPSPKWIRVVFAGQVIANSRRVLLVWDRGRTPVYYFPKKDVRMDLLSPTRHHTHSDTKGDAAYYSVIVGDKKAENAAWTYPKPTTADAALGTPPDLKE